MASRLIFLILPAPRYYAADARDYRPPELAHFGAEELLPPKLAAPQLARSCRIFLFPSRAVAQAICARRTSISARRKAYSTTMPCARDSLVGVPAAVDAQAGAGGARRCHDGICHVCIAAATTRKQ